MLFRETAVRVRKAALETAHKCQLLCKAGTRLVVYEKGAVIHQGQHGWSASAHRCIQLGDDGEEEVDVQHSEDRRCDLEMQHVVIQ